MAVLHNPAEAGTAVSGRPRTRTPVLPGEAPRVKGRTRLVARQDWPLIVHNAHPGDLTWAHVLRHQQQRDDNRPVRPEERRGAVRAGAARVHGLVLCGLCGRRLRVRSLAAGARPSEACVTRQVSPARPPCHTLRGDGVDAAVAQVFLDAMQPAQWAVSLAPLEQGATHARQVERPWPWRRARAQDEADLARRRLRAVDPDHRLVARTLERDGKAQLPALATLEREEAALPPLTARLVSADERHAILAWAPDVPAVWHAPTTTQAERTPLWRCRITDVTVTKRPTVITVALRWQTEAGTGLEVPRPLRAAAARRTPAALVERIRTVAPTLTDRPLALTRPRDGRPAGLGGSFTASKVAWVR